MKFKVLARQGVTLLKNRISTRCLLGETYDVEKDGFVENEVRLMANNKLGGFYIQNEQKKTHEASVEITEDNKIKH